MMRSDTGLRRGLRFWDDFLIALPDSGAAPSPDFPSDKIARSFGIIYSPLIYRYALVGGSATAE